MGNNRRRRILMRSSALAGALSLALAGAAVAAEEKIVAFDVPAQPLGESLRDFYRASGEQIVFSEALVAGRRNAPLKGDYTPDQALAMLLDGTNLTARRTATGVVMIEAPQSGSAAGDGAESGTVEALIVTAQKREEDIQDVPIAISAFTQEDLTRSQVTGGPDLITQVPNMTFTKTNFSSYSVQLRGIGTQAISATTDPAVAVAFNNTPFIRNRFFEQEFYDLQRVEVLRGPQGTLYGRNATAGVVNIISQKPKFSFEAKASGDVSNYNSSRIEGMVNIPLAEDVAALRVAGAWTKRDGYATNELSGNPIDGRDLWSTRVSLRVTPSDRLDMNFIWEHFEEDDDRLRSGKQLCKKDVVTNVAGFEITDYYMELPNPGQGGIISGPQSAFSQGCTRNSLYAKDSFQRPNGIMLPYYVPLGAIALPNALTDPYVSVVDSSDPNVISATNDQPEDLRVIQSVIDPKYRAENDLGQIQISWDINDGLTLSSETSYSVDTVYSLQDFNRFNTATGAWLQPTDSDAMNVRPGVLQAGPNGGVFCDPQLGCSDRLMAVDISTATARQFSQEFRLASSFDGPLNFSLGANYLRGDSEDKYYVFINSISLAAADSLLGFYNGPYVYGQTDNRECLRDGYSQQDPLGFYTVTGCIYMDPNPIESVNDQGHNYFLSKNPYKLISYAVFGELYYQIADNLKVTGGLRWTVDKKDAPRIPTWLLADQSYGYPVAEVIEQEWREPTGRLTVDWKPDFSFTDETLLYASYAHGYKAGGANPPGFVRSFYTDAEIAEAATAASETRPRTFAPEFVDAFELGSKNTMLDGSLTLNLAAFYYDYKDYQISEIVDRSAFNRNFDATVWGVEAEADWRPLENLRLGFKGGYEKTRIGDHEQAIDLMDRTAGDPNWLLIRPFPTYASGCIVPAWLYVGHGAQPTLVNVSGTAGGNPTACELAYLMGLDPVTRQPYTANPPQSTVSTNTHSGTINYAAWSTDLANYPGWTAGTPTSAMLYPGWNPATAPNNGEGILKPLGGNELPNAPNWTATITGDYTIPLANEWLATLHTDLHWQSESWWRVFNDHEYDKLDEYFTMNLAAIFTNEERGWHIMAYIKNVTDETAITGAFLNSDDTGLTTNVFLTEPRLYGLRVTKKWTGGSYFPGLGAPAGDPPLFVELSGQVQRHDSQPSAMTPEFDELFSSNLRIIDDLQTDDLDWGDGGGVKLTYQLGTGPWKAVGAWRFGKTNGVSELRKEEIGDEGCLLTTAYCLTGPPQFTMKAENYADVLIRGEEEHQVIDFEVGREVGFGLLPGLTSNVSAGLRYADLQSSSRLHFRGIPNWDLAEQFAFVKYSTYDLYTADIVAEREFKGAGPTVTWDAAAPLLGSPDAGQFSVDASVKAGVLFGRQKVAMEGDSQEQYFEGNFYFNPLLFPGKLMSPEGPPIVTVSPEARSRSATSPMLDLSLGLSFSHSRFKVGAGYRWERYFNAIDGGFSAREDKDRTIDGPYFKVSVGFGG